MRRHACWIISMYCASVSAAAAQATRDSAGIRIVENAKPAWAAGRAWTLSAQPVLDISGTSGADSAVGQITGATRLTDGRVVIADGSTMQLKFFDTAGHHLKSVGGKGRGPGQFQNFGALSKLPGDTIAIETVPAVPVFSPNGDFVRNMEYGPFLPGTLQTPFVGALGRFDNGTAVVMDFPQGARRPAGAQQWTDSSSLFLVNSAGAVIRSLGTMPMVVFVAGTTHPSPLDFGPEAQHASAARALFVGFSREYAIRVYSADWKLERIVRRAWTPRRFTREEIDAYVDGWMQLWSKKTGAERAAEHGEMRRASYPDYLPAHGTILATPSGELWVREPDLAGAPGCWCVSGVSSAPSTWSVFDAAGRWLGNVSMPPRMTPLEVGADYVLGRMRDTSNAVHAVMYRIDKPR